MSGKHWLDIEPEADDVDLELTPANYQPQPIVASVVAEDMAKGPFMHPGEPIPKPAREAALAKRSTDLEAQAKALVVHDAESFTQAGTFIEVCDSMIKEIEAFFDEDIGRAYAAWKGLTMKRALYRDPLKKMRDLVAGRYATFEREEKARAEAKRREAELAALKEQQEQLRAEAAAREEEAKRLADAAERADSRDEGVALQEQAEAALSEARELKVEAATVQAPVLPLLREIVDEGPKVRANWTFEVVDKLALCKAIAAAEVSLEAFEPNEKYLRARAQADKGSCRIAGVRFFDSGAVVRRRAAKT